MFQETPMCLCILPGHGCPLLGRGREQTPVLRCSSTASLTGKVWMGALVMKEERRIKVCFAHKIFIPILYLKKMKSVNNFQGITHLYLLWKKEFYSFMSSSKIRLNSWWKTIYMLTFTSQCVYLLMYQKTTKCFAIIYLVI